MSDELHFMQSRVRALYVHDQRDRLTAVNQWDGGVVPRFYLGRSQAGNLWRFRSDIDDSLADAINSHCREEPVAADLRAPPALAPACRQLLDAEVESQWLGPAYRFSQPIPERLPAAVAINAGNAGLLRDGLDAWLADVLHRSPFMAIVADGRAVSVCASVRISAAAHEAGVETLPEYRGHGYASAAVSAWAKAVIDAGALPFYSTSWDNSASQAVAANLGLEMIGSDYSIT